MRHPAERVSEIGFESIPRHDSNHFLPQGEAERGGHRADRVRRAVLAGALAERPRLDVGQGMMHIRRLIEGGRGISKI